jgi:hypothetical protein
MWRGGSDLSAPCAFRFWLDALSKGDFAADYFHQNDIVEGLALLINETTARLCWPGQINWQNVRRDTSRAKRRYEVVGVVGDIRDYSYDQKVRAMFYRPYHEFDLAGQPRLS